jgi:hypothetical protein
MYARLVRFNKQHVHCNVPQGWSPDRASGTWVPIQRQHKNDGNDKGMAQILNNLSHPLSFTLNQRIAYCLTCACAASLLTRGSIHPNEHLYFATL